jgi:hypothetical protein
MSCLLADSSSLTERILVGIALVSWVLCAVTVMQSSAEVRATADQKKRLKSRNLEAVFVAPETLTARGLILRRRLFLFGGIFIAAVVYLASLLARPKAIPTKTSSVVSFRPIRG